MLGQFMSDFMLGQVTSDQVRLGQAMLVYVWVVQDRSR